MSAISPVQRHTLITIANHSSRTGDDWVRFPGPMRGRTKRKLLDAGLIVSRQDDGSGDILVKLTQAGKDAIHG